MPSLKGKLPANRSASLAMRPVDIQTGTADTIKRSIHVVTATENPVMRYDSDRKMVVAEVLTMDGMEMRPGRTQLPIVDSHDQSTIRNVLGSLRNVRIEGDEFGGDAVFASDAASQEAFAKMAEGHVNDFSITADPVETIFVQRGEQYTTRSGNVISGPANVITKWTPLDASLVACGADDRSTVRRSYMEATKRSAATMDEILLSQLAAMGMPEGMTDPSQILAWVVGRMGSAAPAAAPVVENAMAPEADSPKVEETPAADKPEEEEEMVAKAEDVKDAVARALADEKKRCKAIRDNCELVHLDRSFADELCDSGISVTEASERIIRKIATKEIGQTVSGSDLRVTASEDDKFEAAARDGLLSRAYKAANLRTPAFDGNNKPSAGHENFARQDLLRLAETCLQRAKIDTSRMSRQDIALVAMGSQGAIQRLRIQRDAYHATGSFANLMLDAANKTLRDGYEEAVYSYSIWSRKGSSAADLKALNRIQFSEFANLSMVPEGTAYPEVEMTDARESYKVEKFGANFSVTWETVVNDDLDAISRIPAMQGNAAKRTINAKVYEVLTSNPLMATGKNLFSTSHASGSNYVTSGAAPGTSTLNAGYTAMALQKGLNATVALNITPRFLIVPRNLEATALALINSTADPAVGGSAAGNSGVANLYGPNGPRRLQVISDALLDTANNAGWYLAASPNEVDTVEYTFLQGEESPVLEAEWCYKTDTWDYKIRQTFAAKAIDWRGMFYNDGA